MRKRTILLAIVVVAALVPRFVPGARAATLPPDFTDTLVASIGSPTALAWTPDGRLLITTQPGRLWVYQNGAMLGAAALDLSARVCANGERGLLGLAIDPAFGVSNRFIYVYYSFRKFNVCENNTANSPVNRVARFTLADTNVVDAASEIVLIDNIPAPNSNHNAGDLQFGKDGNLYVSVGDGGCDYAGGGCAGSNDAARDQHVLLGKILRITRDGGIPAGNPFTAVDSARCNLTGRTDAGKKCQETFAWGLRNPFRFAFDPNAAGTRFFINDVGQNVWEEIDLGTAGADYGWNVREGHCANGSTTNCGAPPAGMTNPLFDYNHGNGCASITGGAFVPSGAWPSAYDGDYLFGDYVCGKIFRLEPAAGGGYTSTEFVTGLGGSSAVHLRFGPYGTTQALYYTTYANGGEVRRIAFTGALNRAPTAAMRANPTSGPAPLAVAFDGSASADPDPGDTLQYLWNFGDGSPVRETTTATTSYTYNTPGTYTAALQVRDNRGAISTTSTVRIDAGNTAPAPTISSPGESDRFYVGQTITLQGSATDAQDGTVPDSSLTWRVIQHHNDHTHPFLGPVTGNNITFTAPAPEDLQATAGSYLEIELTATDSRGLASVVRRDLQPQKVDVTLNTTPAGLQIEVNDSTVTAPTTLVSWQGYVLNLTAPNQTDASGTPWEFGSWSDGGAASHAVTTPPTAATYTATFQQGSLLRNGGFEVDANGDSRPDDWTADKRVTRSTELVHEGQFAMKHTPSGGGNYSVGQSVSSLVGGRNYSFTGSVNIPPTTDSFAFQIQIDWRNARGRSVGTTTIRTYNGATAGWDQTTTSLVAPAGTTSAQLQMVASSLGTRLYVDAFSLRLP